MTREEAIKVLEGLTVKRQDGRLALANNDGSTPMEQMEKIPAAIDRLAACEGTGLEPCADLYNEIGPRAGGGQA